MANSGRSVTVVALTEEERLTLERWARRPTSTLALAQRYRIVLGCAAGKPNTKVAAEIGVWPQAVGMRRRRFAERRLLLGWETLVAQRFHAHRITWSARGFARGCRRKSKPAVE